MPAGLVRLSASLAGPDRGGDGQAILACPSFYRGSFLPRREKPKPSN
jgi:hypothetical protein